MPKLMWRVKLVTELEPGVATETEVARIERGEAIGLADLGLRLDYRAPAGGGEAAHHGAASRDRDGTGGHGGRAPPGSTQIRGRQGAMPPLR